MKQMEVTEKVIGENTFYLKPFPAFVAVNISGDLAAVLTPMLGGIAALTSNGVSANRDTVGDTVSSLMEVEIDDALPVVTKAFSGLSGDKFEKLMKKLLVDYKNISVENEDTGGKAELLTYDLANEVFCGDVQDMFILCFEVIRLNFNGFFKIIGALFGSQEGDQTEAPNVAAGES